MQKSGVVLCALRVFAVKVLSFRHSYRKDANEDNNNFSAQDGIAMVALTPRYQGNNSKPLMATMR